jgi:hypothetical protein
MPICTFGQPSSVSQAQGIIEEGDDNDKRRALENPEEHRQRFIEIAVVQGGDDPEITIAPMMLVSSVLIPAIIVRPLPAVGSAENRRRKSGPRSSPWR